VASSAERARQVQGLHGLGLDLAEHRLAHRLKLPVDLCLTHLEGEGSGAHASTWLFVFNEGGYPFIDFQKKLKKKGEQKKKHNVLAVDSPISGFDLPESIRERCNSCNVT